ncbi:nuclear move domain [Cryptosporidium xiaoi]|uniref:Nuclear move domain n=1 Tax=Cryptosporidium xiaoi TaxID=659607 RepID=A0AAV9Y2Y6_9CRYT
MSKIDYSKWDNITVSSEDESNVFSNNSDSNCRVTKFDTPQKITIGGNAEKLEREDKSVINSEYVDNNCKNKCNSIQNKLFISENKDPRIVDYVCCRSSNTEFEYYWKQSGNEIKLLIPIDETLNRKDINVSVNNVSIMIKAKNNTIISEEFAHEINNNEDCIFWSIIKLKSEPNDIYKKMIFIELEKKQIDSTIRVWWKSVFKGGPETNVNKFRELTEKETDRNRKFEQSWLKAHEEFKRNIKNKRINLI